MGRYSTEKLRTYGKTYSGEPTPPKLTPSALLWISVDACFPKTGSGLPTSEIYLRSRYSEK
jgi:hypothetical protein